MRPATAKPFLFEQSFDEEALLRAREQKLRDAEEAAKAAELEELERNPPPPTFTEEELQAAQAAAWQEGHQAGSNDAQQQNEAQVLALLENLGAQIGGMHVHQDLANERIASELSGFALEICRRVLPDFIDSHGGEEVRALLGDCMEKITPASRILVTVSPDTLGLLEPQIDVLAARSGFEGRIKMVADPALGPSDLVATWDGGNLQRVEKELWQGIEAVVNRARAAAPPAPDLPQSVLDAADAEPLPTDPPAPQEAAPPELNADTPATETETPVDDRTETIVSEEDPNV